ncbi:hypothetical protein [Paraglaciecola arctica]|uniref:hypothetical protein n=1 Tax=Paraglaciecola arctica TaxID=1128911 RepID=UPI001C079832|nr:hypothetical protein [Paraglaciecola arctica]MBU3006034.1 hypothetical protein [Paraglaciecola arctica]
MEYFEIKSIAKTGGTPTNLASVEADENINLAYVKGIKVYYNKSVVTAVIKPLFAGIINEGGSGMSEITDASWFGDLFKTSYAIDSPSH